MTPHALVGAVCDLLDAGELDVALSNRLAAALARFDAHRETQAQVHLIVAALATDALSDEMAGLLAEALVKRHYRTLAEPVELSPEAMARFNAVLGIGTEKTDG
ncbi:hypothetical protein [Frankia sp. AgW1.1]|uniref:hypothetical protein n=1 Tax=Frankia sp. AgW1.1 TaxID=1836971 RepID=UPI0019323701|nr:hypothetical protein [Frankia sp. AgW1.1]MBL7487117.1 hypothetical protein [Frankia sp. AgW1.1]